MPQRLLARGCGSKPTFVCEHARARTCALVHIHIYIHGFGCRADRQRMGVPYSLEDSSGWSVCCLPAAHTPVIHLPLPGPLHSSHYTHRHARTHTHVHKLTTVSVCIVLLCGHKSLGVEGAGERGHQRVDQWG